MPQGYNPAGGYIGPVAERGAQPGWSPREQSTLEQQGAELQAYLTAESSRQLERFRVRRPPAPPPFEPKKPTGEIDETKLSEIIDAIEGAGLRIDCSRLVEYGKTKFEELLGLGRQDLLLSSVGWLSDDTLSG
jgi:hypothetical protein